MRHTRQPLHSRPSGVELNLTPMIDVTFLLIIFFLVSSNLARNEARMALDLPAATTGDAATSAGPRRLTVNVRADGELLLGAVGVSPVELRDRLAAEVAEHGADLRVRLRGDRAAPYAAVEPALAACAEAGVVDLGLVVFRGKGRSDER